MSIQLNVAMYTALHIPNATNANPYDTIPRNPSSYLYVDATAMERTPYTSDTLVDTLHWLRDSFELLSVCIPQQLCLLQNLLFL